MNISESISKNIKIFLTVLALLSMVIGIAGIWGYAGTETVGKAIGTLALIGVTVFVIDAVIYGQRNDGPLGRDSKIEPPKV